MVIKQNFARTDHDNHEVFHDILKYIKHVGGFLFNNESAPERRVPSCRGQAPLQRGETVQAGATCRPFGSWDEVNTYYMW